ncbi:hypothetical protein A8F94_12855 [Bacillus sp. FJAT-27225]|uniref:hypothetical protein n=1 Tax=Bacillus sp. FJAT-27225 TaxID=1743144 RepID=UPI00080C2B84|nr:hypothetical protein [Bacillus sp. FJAT-27225]OCA85756.1 hypothetical protein A8F94_12855 [Bacillus sp. FJAT-27225]
MGTIELGLLRRILRKRYEKMFEDPKLKGVSKVNQEVMIQVAIDDYIKNNILKYQLTEEVLAIPPIFRERNRNRRERSRG